MLGSFPFYNLAHLDSFQRDSISVTFLFPVNFDPVSTCHVVRIRSLFQVSLLQVLKFELLIAKMDPHRRMDLRALNIDEDSEAELQPRTYQVRSHQC